MYILKLIKILLHKPRLLYRLHSSKKYTLAHLIVLKQLLSESIKKDSVLVHETMPSHKKFTNEELLIKAAKIYDIEERIKVKHKDLKLITLKILEFNVKSNNNETIQELSFVTRELESLRKMRKGGKHSYSYTPLYKKLKIEQRIQTLLEKEINLKRKLSKLNDNNSLKLKLSHYTKQLLVGNKLPF
jgi:hypothetical protein